MRGVSATQAEAQLAGVEGCPCCMTEGAVITVSGDEEALASCSKCSSPSDSILFALGLRRTVEMGRTPPRMTRPAPRA